MFTALLFSFALAFVCVATMGAGLVVVWRGARGRLVDDHDHCRAAQVPATAPQALGVADPADVHTHGLRSHLTLEKSKRNATRANREALAGWSFSDSPGAWRVRWREWTVRYREKGDRPPRVVARFALFRRHLGHERGRSS